MVLHELLPFHPLTVDIPMEKQEETIYAVSAQVPACAMWNLLDNKRKEQLPLMTFDEWLRFTQCRSQLDQERMIMTRVLLRFPWLDRAGQIMFRGWFALYKQRRALERKLEASAAAKTASCYWSHRLNQRSCKQR